MAVDLEGLQAHEIVREAGEFWTELGMRSKINSAVAEIREEHNAKRLSWNVEDLQRIIRPYPTNTKVDAVLRKMEDDTWLPEGESPYEAEGEGKSDESEDEEGSEEEVNEEEEEAAEFAALVAIGGTGDTEDVRSSGYDDVEDVRNCGELPRIGCATKADALAESQNTHQRARDGHGVPQGSGGAGICCAAAERNKKREAKGACFQQRRPRSKACTATPKGARSGLGAIAASHVARCQK